MAKFFLVVASILGSLSVAIGAFGAHAWKKVLENNNRVETFELASRYQFYHTLVIVAIGLLLLYRPVRQFAYAGYAFLAGILIFSGSLYVLALTGKTWLGAITPLGGLALIAGWLLLLWGVLKL